MQSLNTFFRTLYLSFTSPRYYADIVRAPFSFSLKYYAGMTILISLIVSTIITIRWILPLNSFLADAPDLIINAYPEELEVVVNSGQVSTNVDEPYVIPFSVLDPLEKRFNEAVLGMDESSLENLIVIDTQATLDDFERYNTWTLVTWDTVSYINDEGNIETVSLEEVDDVTINQQEVSSAMAKMQPYLTYFLPLLALIVFIGSLLYGIIRMGYLLVLTLFIWLAAVLFKTPLTYGKSYQIMLHVSFIPFIVLLVLGLASIRIPVPFFETMLQLLIGIGIVIVLKSVVLENTKSPS